MNSAKKKNMKSTISFQPRARYQRTPGLPWRAALVGSLIGLLGALVFFAPAAWLAAGLSAATSGRLQLLDVRGTVWTGTGRALLTGGTGSKDKAVLPGTLAWQVRPAWAGVKLQINAACCTPAPLQTRLSFGWKTLEIRIEDGASQWPAALLAGLGTPWNTVQAEARMQLTTQNLALKLFEGRFAMSGAAELKALDVSSRLSKIRPMGSYQLVLNGGPVPALELSTLSGALKLSGSGSWVGSKLRFKGVASVDADMVDAFTNLLNIIGRRQGVQSIITLG